jgi:hypothetical protein
LRSGGKQDDGFDNQLSECALVCLGVVMISYDAKR